MNAPRNDNTKLTRTGAKDRNGKQIYLGDRVRRFVDKCSFAGVVVFDRCAFRIKIDEGFSEEKVLGEDCLRYNYSLLWREGEGTENVEKVDATSNLNNRFK